MTISGEFAGGSDRLSLNKLKSRHTTYIDGAGRR